MNMKSFYQITLSALLTIAVGLCVFVFFINDKCDDGESSYAPHQSQDLNEYILLTAGNYPMDGSYSCMVGEEVNKTLGVTQNIYYHGKLVAKGDDRNRSYCVGLIFEVYMKSCQAYAEAMGKPSFKLGNITTDDFNIFRKNFYGVDGNKRTFVRTLVEQNLGYEVNDIKLAQPGDLIQFWRHNGSGHAVIFKHLEVDSNGNPSKLFYWSVQQSSGISDNSENFGNYRNDIDLNRVYIVRSQAPII